MTHSRRALWAALLLGWRPGMRRTQEGAYLVTDVGANRPSLDWLAGYLNAVLAGAGEEAAVPTRDSVVSVYPNPVEAETTLEFELQSSGTVLLSIHDALGRQLRLLSDHHRASGLHEVVWDGLDGSGSQVVSGLYFGVLTRPGGARDSTTIVVAR